MVPSGYVSPTRDALAEQSPAAAPVTGVSVTAVGSEAREGGVIVSADAGDVAAGAVSRVFCACTVCATAVDIAASSSWGAPHAEVSSEMAVRRVNIVYIRRADIHTSFPWGSKP